MKRFYIITLLVAIGVTSYAQCSFNRSAIIGKTALSDRITEFRDERFSKDAISLNGDVITENTPQMKPAHEEEWLYEDGGWFKAGDYYYTYDASGNKIIEKYSDGEGVSNTVSEYDSNNNAVSIITSYSEDGTEFVNSTKRLRTYDEKVADLIVDSQSFTWDNGDWSLVSDGYTYKRKVVRNDKGFITGVLIESYFMGNYEQQLKSTLTYNSDGLAQTWMFEELGYADGGKELVMKEVFTLTDMSWYTTDGQILVMDDLSDFFTDKYNRLKGATVYSGGKITGTVEATYSENGDYIYTYNYTTEPYAKEVYSHSVTDENGSYVETTMAYEDLNADHQLSDDELVFEETLTVLKDCYGRVVDEYAVADEEVQFRGKYDYTYSEEYGSYPLEQIFYDYDFKTSQFVPFLKIVASDFYDVTSSIDEVALSDELSDVAIYNIQGMKLNVDEKDLAPGLYIVKKAGKCKKIYIQR